MSSALIQAQAPFHQRSPNSASDGSIEMPPGSSIFPKIMNLKADFRCPPCLGNLKHLQDGSSSTLQHYQTDFSRYWVLQPVTKCQTQHRIFASIAEVWQGTSKFVFTSTGTQRTVQDVDWSSYGHVRNGAQGARMKGHCEEIKHNKMFSHHVQPSPCIHGQI